jgi:cytochrome c-type biogenesis protein CcmH/NrfG
LLLDRKRIRKVAKWVALLLAIIFCVGAVGIGVGQGVGNVNIFDAFSCANSQTTDSTTPDDRIAALLASLAQDPKNVTTLQALATAYENNNDYTSAAKYLQQAIDAAPTQKDLYTRLAAMYMDKSADYKAAVILLNKAVSLFPDDPDMYINLGLAQRSLGNTSAAIMAWQKFLSLEPTGSRADAIRGQIDTMAAQATTTTSTAPTSTTAGSTPSTAAGSSTTASTAASASSTTTAGATSSTTAP